MATSCRRRIISSADVVGGNDDLVAEILLRLPAKFVVRLKLVSKRWLSLISNRNFSLRHSCRNCNAMSGIILVYAEGSLVRPSFPYVSLDESEGSTEKLTRYLTSFDPHAPAPITTILDSCNGLLLCYARTRTYKPKIPKLYIVNPTIHQFTTLPLPPACDLAGDNFNLVYDPCKSPVYWVYGVQLSNSVCNIHIYSSDTGVWELFSNHSFDPPARFIKGVFWNGAIHWLAENGYSYRFDVDQKAIQKLPRFPLPENWNGGSLTRKYFGQSQGNLYLIALNISKTSKFIVYEMHKDCSGWFVKYSLDTEVIFAAFFDTANYDLLNLDFLSSMVSLVEAKDKGPHLVMYIRGKVVSYCFKDNTFKKLINLHDPAHVLRHAIEYMETLSWI